MISKYVRPAAYLETCHLLVRIGSAAIPVLWKLIFQVKCYTVQEGVSQPVAVSITVALQYASSNYYIAERPHLDRMVLSLTEHYCFNIIIVISGFEFYNRCQKFKMAAIQ